ncbi:putative ubiquitin-protein ligase E3A [Venustampulla echinocandica]|uniref:HECT-type E3 ubiquitin transferase n=1 Tax=Venustampulla echinocandica TaxID=2656787 RepID=A0A370TXW2_9HELO|nr:putative ubiquitin-protein ligase E3A [Venustampulla echinocandica]RDL40376.1 putative ubiquitin-protein ligase E3A [Venustampulla echinocandica]
MAFWSNHSRNELSSTPAGGHSVSPVRASPARSRITEADILESAYGIPTLPVPSRELHGPSNGTATTSNPRRATHGRSMSHPFPSLFPGKKKQLSDKAGGPGFESTDDDSGSSHFAQNPSPISSIRQGKLPDRDLTTGKCMTCDSLVRWPKELKVFRCTVCLTINDLKPITLEARRGDGHRAPVSGNSGTFGPFYTQRVPTLSLEKTKWLIDQCITSYLLDRLKHDDGSTSSSVPSPPQSPVLGPPGSRIPRRPVGSGEAPPNISIPASRGADPGPSAVKFPSSDMEPRESIGRTFQSNGPYGGYNTAPTRYRRNGKGDGVPEDEIVSTRNLFKPLEDYIVTSFGSFECINTSFLVGRAPLTPRAHSEGAKRRVPSTPQRYTGIYVPLSELDAKTLLLGDFAENGSWWTGGRTDISPGPSRTHRKSGDNPNSMTGFVTVKSPRIDWPEINEWYYTVVNAGRSWRWRLDNLVSSDPYTLDVNRLSDLELAEIGNEIMEAQSHTQRVLLKATESLLKRPGRPLLNPDDARFLLIILANPLLYPSHVASRMREKSKSRSLSRDDSGTFKLGGFEPGKTSMPSSSPRNQNVRKGSSGQHSAIIKRILGLMSNLPNECHHHFVSWFARYSDSQFQRTVDLIGSFVTYRLTRQHGKKREAKHDFTAGLVPNLSASGGSSSAALHAALGISGQSPKKSDGKPQPVVYNDDWQIKAAARVMALLFSANNSGLATKGTRSSAATPEASQSISEASRGRAHHNGQILPTSDFYNTLLDYSDLVADFEAWEARRGKFAFCQYPFFLSIWAKIQIMEHDARRQMEVKAREAFFDSIMTHKTVNQYLILKVRRDCLVEDSLKGVSEVVGSGGEEIKKGLRIEFKGEEGIDAGGLRKEWFLLLVREVFNPEHGMFTYDEDSQFCYFNPNSFETTDQFFLVGVVLGLAIYNSTILDVALPPFAFRKLLAAGPVAAPGATSHAKPSMTYSLDDLAEYRPVLANGLRQLLEFEGDVESTLCRDFVADVERYGQLIQIPLCPDGEERPVTNANRREFVDLYVRYLLDTAVARQFEPFKRGFFSVCGGNALSLFRPEEIELLVRGSDEPLDIESLQAVSICENWGVPNAHEVEPVIQWFWQSFQNANPKDQRKLLSFITGSDRIPAMGATNLVIKLSCLGDDSPRFPVARTCFNMISLWRYSSRAKLERMLWRAVYESEGFGLK